MDAQTHEPLSFVSVTVKNSLVGTTTNIDGKFALKLSAEVCELTFSHVGFEDFQYTFKPYNVQETVLISLRERTTTLNEVILNVGEEPSHRIIREAIKRKQFNDPYKLPSFSYQSYNKLYCTLEGFHTDTIERIGGDTSKLNLFLKKNHLFFGESITERKFLKPNLKNEVIIANRMSGYSNPIIALLATDLQPLSFYDDIISLFETKYINPISKGCFTHYRFFLERTRANGSDTTYIISFKPVTGKNFEGLQGIISINSNGYAIENVVAESTDVTALKKFRVQQKYERIDTTWFPVEFNTDIIFKDLKFKGKSLMYIGKTYLSKIQIAPALSKKEFNSITTEMLPEANFRSEEYWRSIRPDSLQVQEANTYQTAKKLRPKTQAILDGFMSYLEGELTNDLKIGRLSLQPDKFYSYNQYEENRFGLGIQTNDRLSRLFRLESYVAYGSKDKALKFGFEAQLNLNTKKDFYLGGHYSKDIVEPGTIDFFEDTRLRLYTSPNWIAYRMDSIEKCGMKINMRIFDRIQTQISIVSEKRNPAYQYTYRSLAKSDFISTQFSSSEVGIGLRYAPKEEFTQIGTGKAVLKMSYPIFALSMGHNVYSNFSRSQYSRVNLNIDYSFYNRVFGETFVRFSSGVIKGDAPYFLLSNGQGSYSTSWPKFFRLKNHFQTMYLYEFLSSQYAYLFLTHNFGKLLYKTNNKYIQPEFLLVQNFGFGKLEQADTHLNINYATLEKGYYETGAMINNIVRFSYINLLYIGIGGGAFYRYGPYAYSKASDNLVFKLSVEFTF